jgi:DNA-binding transcriptional LysR family regulator
MLRESLFTGEVDAALSYTLPGQDVTIRPGIHAATLLHEPQWVIVNAEHRLAQAGPVPLTAFRHEQWILSPPTDPLHAWETAALQAAGIDTGNGHHLDGSTVLKYVASGHGVTFTPAHNKMQESIAVVPVTDALSFHVYLAWRATLPARIVRQMTETVCRHYAQISRRNPHYLNHISDHPERFSAILPYLPVRHGS